LPTAFATGRSAQVFSKNRKTTFADGLCQGRSAHVFSKKIEKQPLPTAFAGGARHKFFSKK
jgi:hypothetical protein